MHYVAFKNEFHLIKIQGFRKTYQELKFSFKKIKIKKEKEKNFGLFTESFRFVHSTYF